MTTTEHLRELIAKASPPPWLNQTPMTAENVELAMALVNAAPALLDVVEAASKARHAETLYAQARAELDVGRALDKLDEVKL